MKKPKGIDERPEQMRPPIVKEVGVTKSERYLAGLAENSFLNLWSFPSPYRDQKTGQDHQGDGKELCDLLVVCGQHVIIFSEKNITWPSADLPIAWNRWGKRAVLAAVKQAKGAERWIADHPQRVFLDRGCSVPFPIELPAGDQAKIHRVIVARGASEACKEHLGSHTGSLIIDPSLKGEMNWPRDVNEARPFAFGDIDPLGSFVHVLDDISLDIVMRELNTIRDFTNYLQRKEDFIRSGRLRIAHGEENLLAYYAIRINEEGEHDFVLEGGQNNLSIDRNHYRQLTVNPQYIAKQEADKISFAWDNLITMFTTHMLDGTSITLHDFEFDLKRNEIAVRYMALETRFRRRSHGQAVVGALEEAATRDCFFRMMMVPEHARDNETAFFIMTFKYLEWMDERGGYEHYRRKRTERSMVYAQGILERYPHLARVIGVSMEPPGQDGGSSEDLIYAEQSNWTDEEREEIRKRCEQLGILQNPIQTQPTDDQEFPHVEEIHLERGPHPQTSPLNRKQRRAHAAKLRKASRDRTSK